MPAASLFALTFVGCHVEAVVLLLCVTVGVNGFNYSGFSSNHIDIASNYSGTLMGITNTLGNLMGFLAPMVVSAIVEGHVSCQYESLSTIYLKIFEVYNYLVLFRSFLSFDIAKNP